MMKFAVFRALNLPEKKSPNYLKNLTKEGSTKKSCQGVNVGKAMISDKENKLLGKKDFNHELISA